VSLKKRQVHLYKFLVTLPGINASKWTPLGPIHTSNCVVDETAYIWLAEDLVEGKGTFQPFYGDSLEIKADPDGDEVLRTRRIPLSQAIKEAQAGKIYDSMTVVGLYKAFHFLQSREKVRSQFFLKISFVESCIACLRT
jgi:hypothetical protein